MQSIFPLADKITSSRSVPSQRILCMGAVNAGPRDSVTTLGITRKKSGKLLLLRFMEALKESRRREARRVIANNAHLLANRDTPDSDNQT
jgi:hypothetical protein